MVAACLLVWAAVAAGCGGGDDDAGTTASGTEPQDTKADDSADAADEGAAMLGPAEVQESVQDARRRIAEALASKDCEEINELNPVSRPGLSNERHCGYLQRLDGLESTGAEGYGEAGAVIDYESGDRTVSAVLVLDQDGLYRIAFLNSFNEKPTVGTPYAEEFDAAAEDAVESLEDTDCAAYRAVVFRRFGLGAQDEEQVCAFVEKNPISNLIEAQPDAQLERAGGSGAYAFYLLGTPSVNLTLVLARERDRGAPPNAAKLPKDAAEYGYVGAYRTNDTASE